MEPIVLFDNGGHHSPQDEHMRNVVLSAKHLSGIGSIDKMSPRAATMQTHTN